MSQPVLVLVRNDVDPVPAIPADYTYEMWLDDLQGIVWHRFIKGHQSLESLCVASGLHPKTVEKFVWRTTKKPAAKTVFQMARAVGFRNPWIPENAPTQPAEQDFRSLREALPPK